jgi:hypothetical protein
VGEARQNPPTLLRNATIGYNVSFEKPVVVRHDRASLLDQAILDR